MINLSFLTWDSEYEFKKPIMIMFIVYLIVIIAFASIANNIINGSILEELGNKAMSLASIVAADLKLSKTEVDKLIDLEFNQLLLEPVNIEFENKLRNTMDFSETKYVYLITELPEEKIKYKVEENEETKYDSPAGTPLNAVYLLDAVVKDDIRRTDTNGKGYVDKDRYTIMKYQCKKAFVDRKPVFYINEDRWGKYITGYAPSYDGEGNFIGLIGVDILLDSYTAYSRRNLMIIVAFALTLITIGIGALHLIFKIKIAEKRIEEKSALSNTDYLTDIMNRRGFFEELYKSWTQSTKYNMPISLLIIDIDFFKEYNDNYGHLSGDKLICDIAHILGKSIKRSSDFVGRYGGDEFVIILRDTGFSGARKVAMRIMENVRALKIKHGYSKISPYVTLSIGVSTMIATSETKAQELINRADKALYKAKKSGRNSVQFSAQNSFV